MNENEFSRLMEWLRERVSEGQYATADDFIEQVFGKADRYDDDMSVRDAKIRQLTGERDGFAADLQAMKAKNYDLLMQIPAVDDNQGNDGDGEVVENVEEDGQIYHIDNLFADVDEED